MSSQVEAEGSAHGKEGSRREKNVYLNMALHWPYSWHSDNSVGINATII
jgi:hypothetical protein